MKIVLYSGGQTSRNHRLHQELVRLSEKKSPSFTYLIAQSEHAQHFFERAKRRYAIHGVKKFRSLVLDQSPSRNDISQAMKSDIIYLPGGNTFEILYHLRRLKLLPLLMEHSKNGGVLAGLSAGALILTPSIELAGYPKFDADPNTVGLKNLKSLALVPFDFFPHFYSSPRLIQSLCLYSKRSGVPLYASADGGGILIDGEYFKTFGATHLFYQGQYFCFRRTVK